eukprot:gene2715-13519_t
MSDKEDRPLDSDDESDQEESDQEESTMQEDDAGQTWEELKAQGNALYKEKQYIRAIEAYVSDHWFSFCNWLIDASQESVLDSISRSGVLWHPEKEEEKKKKNKAVVQSPSKYPLEYLAQHW